MALTLPRWIMWTSVACAAIATTVIVRYGHDQPATVTGISTEARAAYIARMQYSRAYRQWRTLVRRDSIVATLAGRRVPRQDAPLVTAGNGVSSQAVAVVDRLARRQWRALGIDSARTAVIVAIVPERAGDPELPNAVRGSVAFDYIIPPRDSDAPCVTVVMLPRKRTPESGDDAALSTTWVRVLGGPEVTPFLLGPCAFYARFGHPGRPVEEWIASREYDLIATPSWTLASDDVADATGPEGRSGARWRRQSPFTEPGLLLLAYSATVEERACVAGQVEICSELVSPVAHRASLIPPGLVARESLWEDESVFSRAVFLSDLASYVGVDRFAVFWTSPAPITSAIVDATGLTLGEWTRRWALAYYPNPPHVGPAVTAREGAFGVLLVAGFVGLACVAAGRRQVR